MSARLRAITLSGFKSFGERTRIELGPGVNVVVGPNGSGKSNVVEAVRWASHTARARDLRARNATELIFHGAQGKAPLGLAEVDLELEELPGGSEAGLLASSASVSRRLYRTGESELELSGRAVRVRDLHDVLRGTGLGPGGLAVVGQGELGAVVSADAATLLAHVEEAAGLSRASHRRAQTLERLMAARAHLSDVAEVALELRERVARLASAALDAGEWEALRLERAAIERAMAVSRVEDLRHDQERCLTAVQDAESRAAAAAVRLDETAASLDLARRDREATQADLADATASAERTTGERRLAQERARQARATVARLDAERAALEAELARLGPHTGPASRPAAPDDDLGALEAALGAAGKAMSVAEAASLIAASALDDARRRRSQAEMDRAASTAHAAAVGAVAAAAAGELARAREDLERLAAARDQAQALMTSASDGLGTAAIRLNETEERRSKARQVREHLERERRALEGERAPLARELARLETALGSHARFGEGPRKALSAGLEGVLGAVGDLVRVPAELEAAVGAALGRRVENVVVRLGEDAERAIAHLRAVGGRATFLPLELILVRTRRGHALLTEPGVRGIAADLVGSDYSRLAEHLLGDTVVVDTIQTAVALARRHSRRPRLVSLDGELVEPGGAVTGGRGRDAAGGGHLADARRAEELRHELSDLDRRAGAAASEAREWAAVEEGAETSLAAARDELRDARSRAGAATGEATATASRLDVARERLLDLERRAASVPDPGPPEALSLPDVEEPAELAQRAAAAHQWAADAERAADRALREALERRRLHEERLRTHDEAQRRGEEAARRRRAAHERLAELESERVGGATDERLADAQARKLESLLASVGLDARRSAVIALDARRRELEAALAAASSDLSASREDLEALRLTLARRESGLGAAISALHELGPAAAGERPPDGPPRSWPARLRAVIERAEAIGPVNGLAAVEHEVEVGRLTELEAGACDARDAVLELESALYELERDVGARLRSAVARVARAFRVLSGELLGGQGEVEIMSDDAGGVAGLALAVQPRGKRTRSLHLLSTGERAMAALAFLFALAEAPEGAGGLPLAVLDEVDAPLDEANIRRFTRFLRLLADRGTQFVLVTHQKATMEVADCLWGVTTDSSGLSRAYSIRSDPATAA